jgi:membrane-bound lytic murein transglycosylase F
MTLKSKNVYFLLLFLLILTATGCTRQPLKAVAKEVFPSRTVDLPTPAEVKRPSPEKIQSQSARSISMYDDLFRQIAEEENLDWRLISAIAYNESRYQAHLVSPRGARGLMQVMPATARAFEVPVDELLDPETNVRAAVKLIRRIEKTLHFSPETSGNDRTNIMLACYNGGIGHVTDARRLAEKYGADPDSWSDVAHYLKLISQPQYAEDEVVSCGAFKGATETINFVNRVTGKYYAYCRL